MSLTSNRGTPPRSAFRRHKRALWLAAAACVAFGAACRGDKPRADPGPPNVLIIVIDSLRVDRVGAYGSRKGLTPFLDRLASESIVYERAYVQTSWTVPSVASLFLGRYPSEHQVVRFSKAIPDEAHTLAEILQENGFATAAVTANASIHILSGFPQGFEKYELVVETTIWNPK
jgi:arylsulfatase A-like enzyme